MIIIGTGRIGGMLIERAASRNVPVSVVTRESGWSAIVERTNPIFVTVRTTDLSTVMARIPVTRIPDVILCQNGMLTPWLHEQNWSQVTRGVLYMAVPKRGAPVQLADPSPFSGPQAKAVVDWFSALDLPVTETTSDRFQQIEVEKLLWNCVFGLLCHVIQKSVGTLCVSEASAIASMTEELLHVAAVGRGVHLDVYAVLRGMLDYSATIPDYVGRVSDWEFRNGWFVRAASSLGLSMPTHERWASQL